jgi:hypothetical protein
METNQMNAPTLKALKESIAHWTRLANGTRKNTENLDAKCCALCRRFVLKNRDCGDCPVVRSQTGQSLCQGTPFYDAQGAMFDHGFDSPFFKAEAKKELAFLKSLLPKRGKK